MPADPLAGLNDRQREAVQAIAGPLLIVAGPGSGKTRVITHRIAYLIGRAGVSPHRIAALTFTNKAAREMQTRLFERNATVRNSGLTVGTFHSFCARLLRTDGEVMGLDRNFAIYDAADQTAAIKRAMSEVDVNPKAFSPGVVLSKISKAKSELVGVEGFGLNKQDYVDEVAHRVYEQYEHMLAQSSALDFDDLLFRTHTLLNEFPRVAKKYQDRYVHFMIDEFQDTNVAQYAIARKIAEGYNNLAVVGDPDQSIYSWRNAKVGNILSFERDFPTAKRITLEESYRSTRTILDVAQNVIAANSQRVEKDMWTNNALGTPIVVREEYKEEDEAQYVIREVHRLTRAEGFALGDVAVMYRVNAQSRALEEACLRFGVAYQVVGGQKFYQRQEIKDLAAYLRLVSNPHDDVALERVINVPARGIGRRTLDHLTRSARDRGTSMYAAIESVSEPGGGPFPPRSAQALTRFRDMIGGLTDESRALDIVELIDLVMERTGYRQHLESTERGEDRLDNVQEFRSSAREYTHLGVEEALTAFLEGVSLVSDVDTFEEQPDAITLITLHQSKGLEFPVVFIVGMEEGLMPHSRSMGTPDEIEEERRLCYVGVTRAQKRLYLLRAFRRGFWGGSGPSDPSRFLEDIPRDLIEGATPSEAPKKPAAQAAAPSARPERPARRRPAANGSSEARPAVARARRRVRDRHEAEPAAPTAAYTTGDKVRHPAFGDGIVMSCTPSGGDFQLTVAFKEGHGVKRLLLGFAPLEKIG